MALDATQRLAVRDRLMQYWSDVRDAFTHTKPELATLVADLDTFVENNAAAINTAITAGIRSKFTAGQKAIALAYVCLKRAGVL